MPLFRKRPVVIEARQFVTNNDQDDQNLNDLVLWVRGLGGEARHDRTDLYVDTLEGTMKATVGDWIVRGVKGEFYPCKPEIFEATHEPA